MRSKTRMEGLHTQERIGTATYKARYRHHRVGRPWGTKANGTFNRNDFIKERGGDPEVSFDIPCATTFKR